VIAPLAIGEIAGEWQLIGSALVLAQHLDRRPRWRRSGTIEFSQSSIARCHGKFPVRLIAARPRRLCPSVK
jgi:hypothetical protein